jgi:periplasmic divalent cation tolerance protein
VTYAVVFVMAPSAEEAGLIGRALVDDRLAACANVVPSVASAYWWQGRVEEAGEALIILKTRQELLPRLVDRVKALHSYTVPEVIALPILGGNPDYLRWIDESVIAGEAHRI